MLLEDTWYASSLRKRPNLTLKGRVLQNIFFLSKIPLVIIYWENQYASHLHFARVICQLIWQLILCDMVFFILNIILNIFSSFKCICNIRFLKMYLSYNISLKCTFFPFQRQLNTKTVLKHSSFNARDFLALLCICRINHICVNIAMQCNTMRWKNRCAIKTQH